MSLAGKRGTRRERKRTTSRPGSASPAHRLPGRGESAPEQPHRLEELEAAGPFSRRSSRFTEATSPALGGHRLQDSLPLADPRDGLGEGIDRGVEPEEPLQHRREQEHAGAGVLVLVEQELDLQAAREADAPAAWPTRRSTGRERARRRRPAMRWRVTGESREVVELQDLAEGVERALAVATPAGPVPPSPR